MTSDPPVARERKLSILYTTRTHKQADRMVEELRMICVRVPCVRSLPRTEAQIRYYEKRFPGHGQEYCYIMPTLRRASQAAGRPIQTLEDREAIVLLDYRFSRAFRRQYLPAWINRSMMVLTDEEGAIAEKLMTFFGSPPAG